MTKRATSDSELVDVREMALILKVPPSWLYERTRKGSRAIPQVRLGKYVRFRADQVVKFFEAQRAGGTRRKR